MYKNMSTMGHLVKKIHQETNELPKNLECN